MVSTYTISDMYQIMILIVTLRKLNNNNLKKKKKQLLFYITGTLQTRNEYFTLKRRENRRLHVVSTWNTRGVFVWYRHHIDYYQIGSVQDICSAMTRSFRFNFV